MTRIPLLTLSLLLFSGADGVKALDCEEAAVDRADSPRFFEAMRQCEDSDRGAAEPESEAAVPEKAVQSGQQNLNSPGEVSSRSVVAGNAAAASNSLASGELPTLHRARERYDLAGSAVGADSSDIYRLLARKMARQCPGGWEKFREWVEISGDGYIMNIEFGCL